MTSFNFDFDDIRRQFFDFMQSLGIQPNDESDIKFDGELHRYRIHDDKKGHTSGAYLVHIDGWPAGYAQDWRKGIKENWRYDISGLEIDDEQRRYFSSEEYRKKCEEEHCKAEQKRAYERTRKSELARQLWNRLQAAPNTHAYLKRKHVKNYGLRLNDNTGCLAVPLWEVSGRLSSIQWIREDGQKFFYDGAELKGAFYSEKLFTYEPDYDGVVLLGEGYATMAKVHELTGYPIAAAMSCYRLEEIAKKILTRYQNAKIIITADNDWETSQENGGHNPGLFYAQGVVKRKLATGVVAPSFKADEHGSDWDDYALLHGDEETADILRAKIQFECLPDNIKAMLLEDKLQTINAQALRHQSFSPIKWAVPGLIPSGLSILGGGPKIGKSIFSLNIAMGISLGGVVLGKINVERGDVLYLALEDNQRRLKERIESAGLSKQDDLSRLTLTTRVPRQHEGGIEYVRWWLDSHTEARLVIIDTLQKFRKQLSGKGNVYAEDYDVISELKKIADEYDVAFLVIHHLKKMSAKEEATSDWINSFSGSAGLSGSADALFVLKRTRSNTNGIMYRTGRDVEEKEFTLRLDGFGWYLDGEAEAVTLPTWKKQVLDYLKEHESVTPIELSDAVGISLEAAKKNLQRITKEELVVRVGHGKYKLA